VQGLRSLLAASMPWRPAVGLSSQPGTWHQRRLPAVAPNLLLEVDTVPAVPAEGRLQVEDSVKDAQGQPLRHCLVSAATRAELSGWNQHRVSAAKAKVGAVRLPLLPWAAGTRGGETSRHTPAMVCTRGEATISCQP